MSAAWLSRPRSIEVDCTIDIEQTSESFHAYAVPDGIDIRPGDTVLLHDAPTDIRFGDRINRRGRATVVRASWLGRAWTHVTEYFELSELYEVGFQPLAEAGASRRRHT